MRAVRGWRYVRAACEPAENRAMMPQMLLVPEFWNRTSQKIRQYASHRNSCDFWMRIVGVVSGGAACDRLGSSRSMAGRTRLNVNLDEYLEGIGGWKECCPI